MQYFGGGGWLARLRKAGAGEADAIGDNSHAKQSQQKKTEREKRAKGVYEDEHHRSRRGRGPEDHTRRTQGQKA